MIGAQGLTASTVARTDRRTGPTFYEPRPVQVFDQPIRPDERERYLADANRRALEQLGFPDKVTFL